MELISQLKNQLDDLEQFAYEVGVFGEGMRWGGEKLFRQLKNWLDERGILGKKEKEVSGGETYETAEESAR